MEERIKAMKKYVGASGSGLMIALPVIFVAIAAALTALGLRMGFTGG